MSFEITNSRFDCRTFGREISFYKVAHIPQAYPFDRTLQGMIEEACKELGFRFHPRTTVLADEGPRYNTRAESKLFELWGGDVINMTSVPEAALAAELGLVYASIAMITDSDCVDEEEEYVTVDLVNQRMSKFKGKIQKLLPSVIKRAAKYDWTDLMEAKKKEARRAIIKE